MSVFPLSRVDYHDLRGKFLPSVGTTAGRSRIRSGHGLTPGDYAGAFRADLHEARLQHSRTIEMAVKRLVRIAVLTIMWSSALVGQARPELAKWVGTWVLNTSESKFGSLLMPGAPSDLAILGQVLRLERAVKVIRLSGETTFRDSSGKRSSHDDNSLSIDGAEAVIGPISLSFRPVDDSTFEIISQLKHSNPNLVEVSHFSVSPDGKKLTETKTQTEREVVPQSSNKPGAVIRTATSVLVLGRQP